jgi:hypothetical protein
MIWLLKSGMIVFAGICENSQNGQKYTHVLTSEDYLVEDVREKTGWSMSDLVRIQVLISPEEAERFDRYCRERGFKKSTLIARLIREYLDTEQYWPQKGLFDTRTEGQPRE